MSSHQRYSNFELLRLVSIFFVILHHLVIKGADTCGYITPFAIQKGVGGVFINSMCIMAVNVFILITGWFGIKKNHIFKFINIILEMTIIGLIMYLICIIGKGFCFGELVNNVSIVHNWFLLHYSILIIVSPLLEKCIDSSSDKSLGYFIIILTVVNVIFGYGLKIVNINGYNYLNFIYLYFIGRWLHRISSTPIYYNIRKLGLFLFILLALLLSVSFIIYWSYDREPNSIRFWSYNNPLVIMESVVFFIWFSGLKFESKLINHLATGVLCVYIYHTTPSIINNRNMIASFAYSEFSYAGIVFFAVIILLVGLLMGVCVDFGCKKISAFICERVIYDVYNTIKRNR